MLTHLRRNAVAYLALFVALSTGSAYAAQELPKKLPKNSVGTKQLKHDAVVSSRVKNASLTGADIQDGSLGSTDLVAGLLPARSELLVASGGINPSAAPDVTPTAPRTVVTARAGTALVRADVSTAGASCSAGSGLVGLHVDGAPVPLSAVGAPSDAAPAPLAVAGVVTLAAGSHEVRVSIDCPSGFPMSSTLGIGPVTVIVVP